MKTSIFTFRQFMLPIMLLFLSNATLLSQEACSIRGTVQNKRHKKPVLYATVALLRASDSTLVTGAATDLDGRFGIKGIPKG